MSLKFSFLRAFHHRRLKSLLREIHKLEIRGKSARINPIIVGSRYTELTSAEERNSLINFRQRATELTPPPREKESAKEMRPSSSFVP